MAESSAVKQITVGVAIIVIAGVLTFFGREIWMWCCETPEPVLTSTSVRIFRVDPDNLSRCELKNPVQIMSDGTQLGLVATDLRKSAVILVFFPNGATHILNGVGLKPVSIPKTNVILSAASLAEIDECSVRINLSIK